jgi:hypothetical protein
VPHSAKQVRRSEGALGFLGKSDRSRKFAGSNFGEEIFEGDIIFFAREFLPAKYFFCKRNPSHNFAGRNFRGHFLGDRNPSRNFGGIFFVREILPAKIAGRNVAETGIPDNECRMEHGNCPRSP